MGIGSTIVVEYGGLDISDHVLYAESSFEFQMAAVPGTAQIVVKDPDQIFDFVTGEELTLDVDGIRMWGGWGFQITKQYAFPADDTSDVGNVRARQWLIAGSDYNTLFDKRVLRQSGDETHDIPDVAGTPTDADVIIGQWDTYFDIPAGFDFTDAGNILATHTYDAGFAWPTQGVKMREVLDGMSLYGAVYYIDANKSFHFVPVQETLSDWGLSDAPNDLTVAAAALATVTATTGFRDGEMTEDATGVVNDALVWGGSEWAGDGDIVFSRREDSTSIADHGRWQIGEVRVGQPNYKSFAEVDGRAKAIVNGNVSGTFAEGSQGLVNPDKQFRATWFSHQTPSDSTHLLASQVVPIELWVFSQDGGVTPFSMNVPLRQIRISFPSLEDATGDAYVQFDGTFGVQMSDPYWLWAFLRGIKPGNNGVIVTASNGTSTGRYGAKYQDEPSGTINGSNKTFTIPFGYIATTTQVFLTAPAGPGGVLQRIGVDYSESDPANGVILFTVAPATGSALWVVCYLLGT